MDIRIIALVSAIAFLVSGFIGAQFQNKKAAPLVSAQDQIFVIKAAQSTLAEVALGKLASIKGGSNALKRFGEYVAKNHTRTNHELSKIAQSKGMSLPTAPSARHQKLATRLEQLEGAEFDSLYIHEAAIESHSAAIALFELQATRGHDPELRAFAAKTLPAIKQHLEIVMAIWDRQTASKKMARSITYI